MSSLKTENLHEATWPPIRDGSRHVTKQTFRNNCFFEHFPKYYYCVIFPSIETKISKLLRLLTRLNHAVKPSSKFGVHTECAFELSLLRLQIQVTVFA